MLLYLALNALLIYQGTVVVSKNGQASVEFQPTEYAEAPVCKLEDVSRKPRAVEVDALTADFLFLKGTPGHEIRYTCRGTLKNAE